MLEAIYHDSLDITHRLASVCDCQGPDLASTTQPIVKMMASFLCRYLEKGK